MASDIVSLSKRVQRQRLVIFGLAVALVFTLAGYGIASAGVLNGNGTINACYKATSGKLRVAVTACKASEKPITLGGSGTQGLPGQGFDFTTTTGNPGPSLADGNYFVDAIANLSGRSSADTGVCAVAVNEIGFSQIAFSGTWALSASAGNIFSFTGMADVGAGSDLQPGAVQLYCSDSTNNTVTPASVTWWVSSVGT